MSLPENASLRDAIRAGLGDKWTMDLEDALFWTTSEFVSRVAINSASMRSVSSKADAVDALNAIRVFIESK